MRYFTQLCRQCVADALYFENWAFSKSALALKETIYTKAADEGMITFSRIIVQTLGVGEIQSTHPVSAQVKVYRLHLTSVLT